MVFRYVNLDHSKNNLLEIKNKHVDLDLIFIFLDNLSLEIKKNQLKKSNKSTIYFIDYKDYKRYMINVDTANSILKKCYDDYYLSKVLFDINNYIKPIWSQNKWFDIFSRNLFFSIKTFILRNKKITYFFLLNAIINCSVKDFSDINQFNDYCIFVKNKLKLLNLNFLKDKYEKYLFLSSETFIFSIKKNSDNYSRFYKYFDLKQYLNSKEYIKDSSFIINDKSIQWIILSCFIKARILRNGYSDNCYIKSLIDSDKKIPEVELNNFNECLHFNNL